MRTPSLFFLRTAALGAMVFAFGFARPALIPSVHAADEAASSSEGTVDVDYLFGGDAGSADEFGGATGLGTGDLTLTIAAVIRALLGFLGLIAVFVILLGGWKWMMSQGVEQKVTDA
ncbi:MAG TPA: hypothetical protein VJB99_02140, partial [Patescibacteria group bacterium]|nr:hypothetical protein [Patescibacteria group bacterium]